MAFSIDDTGNCFFIGQTSLQKCFLLVEVTRQIFEFAEGKPAFWGLYPNEVPGLHTTYLVMKSTF